MLANIMTTLTESARYCIVMQSVLGARFSSTWAPSDIQLQSLNFSGTGNVTSATTSLVWLSEQTGWLTLLFLSSTCLSIYFSLAPVTASYWLLTALIESAWNCRLGWHVCDEVSTWCTDVAAIELQARFNHSLLELLALKVSQQLQPQISGCPNRLRMLILLRLSLIFYFSEY